MFSSLPESEGRLQLITGLLMTCFLIATRCVAAHESPVCEIILFGANGRFAHLPVGGVLPKQAGGDIESLLATLHAWENVYRVESSPDGRRLVVTLRSNAPTHESLVVLMTDWRMAGDTHEFESIVGARFASDDLLLLYAPKREWTGLVDVNEPETVSRLPPGIVNVWASPTRNLLCLDRTNHIRAGRLDNGAFREAWSMPVDEVRLPTDVCVVWINDVDFALSVRGAEWITEFRRWPGNQVIHSMPGLLVTSAVSSSTVMVNVSKAKYVFASVREEEVAISDWDNPRKLKVAWLSPSREYVIGRTERPTAVLIPGSPGRLTILPLFGAEAAPLVVNEDYHSANWLSWRKPDE